jgi:hypothetical protein
MKIRRCPAVVWVEAGKPKLNKTIYVGLRLASLNPTYT